MLQHITKNSPHVLFPPSSTEPPHQPNLLSLRGWHHGISDQFDPFLDSITAWQGAETTMGREKRQEDASTLRTTGVTVTVAGTKEETQHARTPWQKRSRGPQSCISCHELIHSAHVWKSLGWLNIVESYSIRFIYMIDTLIWIQLASDHPVECTLAWWNAFAKMPADSGKPSKSSKPILTNPHLLPLGESNTGCIHQSLYTSSWWGS